MLAPEEPACVVVPVEEELLGEGEDTDAAAVPVDAGVVPLDPLLEAVPL